MATVTKYQFKRKIQYLVQNGLHLEHPTEKYWTGFIIDTDLQELIKGKKLVRTVDEFDGDYGFDTSTQRDDELYIRPQIGEITGRVKDFQMSQYPFAHGQTITIQIKTQKTVLKVGDEIQIIIKTR